MNKKYIFDSFLLFLSRATSKKVLYISNTHIKASNFAVKSNYGFWYCGNVFDQSDIAYGVANNGTAEAYDTALVQTILKRLPENFVFFDVGANTGWYTMIASHVSEKSRVYSFEPIQDHIECMEESIKINRKENQTTIHKLALSDTEGEATILLAGSGSSLENTFLNAHTGTLVIKTEKIDTLILQEKLPSPDFIKIDVEGHEYKVIQGARTTLQEAKPILFIEIAKTLKNIGRDFIHPDFENIFTELAKIGYKPYRVSTTSIHIFDPKETPDGVYMYLFLDDKKHKNILEILNL